MHVFLYCLQCAVVYICFVTTELLCRPSSVPKSKVPLANRAAYATIATLSTKGGHVLFLLPKNIYTRLFHTTAVTHVIYITQF